LTSAKMIVIITVDSTRASLNGLML
jgi:hypothetical protein